MARRGQSMEKCPFKVGDRVLVSRGGWARSDCLGEVTRVLKSGHVEVKTPGPYFRKFYWRAGDHAYESGGGGYYERWSIRLATDEDRRKIARKKQVAKIAGLKEEQWDLLEDGDLAQACALAEKALGFSKVLDQVTAAGRKAAE